MIRERALDVDGVRIHVAEAGQGPALVLLHGLTATHFTWQHTIPAFADRWRVVAPDLPGHGRSGKPDAPYTPDFYAGVVRSLGRALGIGDAVVVGNSLGGRVALELALAYPRWTRAVGVAAPAGGYAAGMRAVGWAIDAVAGPRVLGVALPRTLDWCFHDPTLAACEERRRLLADRLAADDAPGFARAVTRTLRELLADGRPPLGGIRQPALVVWGREDRLIALAASRRLLREIPHARLAVVDGCGHLPMVERPDEFNRVLGEFLRAVDAAPRAHAAGA